MMRPTMVTVAVAATVLTAAGCGSTSARGAVQPILPSPVASAIVTVHPIGTTEPVYREGQLVARVDVTKLALSSAANDSSQVPTNGEFATFSVTFTNASSSAPFTYSWADFALTQTLGATKFYNITQGVDTVQSGQSTLGDHPTIQPGQSGSGVVAIDEPYADGVLEYMPVGFTTPLAAWSF